MKKIILTIVLATMGLVAANAQNKLTVEVTGIDNPTGDLYIALYDNSSTFLGFKPVDGKVFEIKDVSATITFEGVKEGQHAIAIFQDENKNGKLDMGEYGIPMEKYGFSNGIDPAIIKRMPNFEECKFEIKGDTALDINLVSAIR